jgi:uncharacterized membrane protein YqjE
MNSPESESPGMMESLRSLGANLVGTLHDRVELFSLELEEERARLIRTMVWISIALFLGMMTAVLLSLTVVYLFWDSARIYVLVGLTLLYGGGLIAAVVSVRRSLARQPRPFAATLAELEEDQACIRDRK